MFPIWNTGYVASDYDLNIDEKPIFYIDARTRTGHSGSPVIIHRTGEAVKLLDGSLRLDYTGTHLLGIYSGRIKNDSDIGRVWKLSAINHLLSYHFDRVSGRNKICPCGSFKKFKYCHGKI